MKKRAKVVLAMIEAGGGHKSTALAISESLKAISLHSPEIEVLDFCSHVGANKFDIAHKKMWNKMLKHTWVTKIGFQIQDFAGPIARWFVRKWAFAFFEKAAEWFKDNDPDIFIPTHWLNSAAALYAKKKYPHLNFKHFHFLTEPFDSSSIHHWKGADRYFVGSQHVANQLEHFGIKTEQISIFGYPVRNSFFHLPDTLERIKQDLGCLPNRLTVLMSGGAEGIGKFSQFVQKIIESELPLNLIVVCGYNALLKSELKRKADIHGSNAKGPHIIALGYVHTMNQLVAISDVSAIKAGPASTFETFFWKKPIIFYEYVARHEKANIDYVVSQQGGWYTPRFSQFKSLLSKLCQDEGLIVKAKEQIAQSLFENGAYRIAHFIDGALFDRK